MNELFVPSKVVAAITQINAISVSAHTIRVELREPSAHTVRFPRSVEHGNGMRQMVQDLRDGKEGAYMTLADTCRVLAYRFGAPCKRNLVTP